MSKANLNQISIYYNLSEKVPQGELSETLKASLRDKAIKLVTKKEFDAITDPNFKTFLESYQLVSQGKGIVEREGSTYSAVITQYPELAEIFDPIYEFCKKYNIKNRLPLTKEDGTAVGVWFSPVWRSVAPSDATQTEE